jgi:hypothetical protein
MPIPTATKSPPASPTASPAMIIGDVNGDGIVNVVDLSTLLAISLGVGHS